MNEMKYFLILNSRYCIRKIFQYNNDYVIGNKSKNHGGKFCKLESKFTLLNVKNFE